MLHHDPGAPWKLILAVDGSYDSLAAAALLHDLPWPPGSACTLLAVHAPRAALGRDALHTALASAHDVLRAEHLAISEELVEGHPAEQLATAADTQRPDLLVVGAKGLRATLGILLGGVAQQVVEYAGCPVLVVRAPADRPHLQRVLAAIDSSCASQGVVDYIGGWPLPAGATISVMHVLPPLTVPNYPPPTWLLGRPPEVPQLYPDTETALASAAAEEADGKRLLAQAAHAWPDRCAGQILTRGDAATEILERARADGTDLLVAGSRGLSAVRGWWFGSVSRKLVHYAPCSVLIVKDQPA